MSRDADLEEALRGDSAPHRTVNVTGIDARLAKLGVALLCLAILELAFIIWWLNRIIDTLYVTKRG